MLNQANTYSMLKLRMLSQYAVMNNKIRVKVTDHPGGAHTQALHTAFKKSSPLTLCTRVIRCFR